MIDSTIFGKQEIISWEKRDVARKTWPKARKPFEKLIDDIETYTHLVGSTDIK